MSFKDKNKKANSWEKIGEKFDLSAAAAEAEVKFRNIRTAYGIAKRISKPGMAQSTYRTQTIRHKLSSWLLKVCSCKLTAVHPSFFLDKAS